MYEMRELEKNARMKLQIHGAEMDALEVCVWFRRAVQIIHLSAVKAQNIDQSQIGHVPEWFEFEHSRQENEGRRMVLAFQNPRDFGCHKGRKMVIIDFAGYLAFLSGDPRQVDASNAGDEYARRQAANLVRELMPDHVRLRSEISSDDETLYSPYLRLQNA